MTQTAYRHIALLEDGTPVVVETRLKVKDLIAEHLKHALSPEALQGRYPQLTLAQVYSALAYYEDHRDELAVGVDRPEAHTVEKPRRMPNLHSGAFIVHDDFDAPLPDSFWLGEDSGENPGDEDSRGYDR